jgi:ankyrin repeat protein
VEELLDNGADLEGPLGLLQSTPLQWSVWHQQLDVVRLLLSRGASQDHINTIGWNVTFFCWPRLEFGNRSMLDYLNVLSDDAVQELDVVDTEAWTVLHRVAAYATARELLELIRQGARPEQEALPLRWNALHHAVFYGNEDTYKALIPYFEDDVHSMRDERGWTLLHIAASAGHDTIVRDLLIRGADPDALSKPFMSHMPESLHGRACTPRQVARAQSSEEEARYVHAMRVCGKIDIESKLQVNGCSDDDDEDDIFWEVSESLA